MPHFVTYGYSELRNTLLLKTEPRTLFFVLAFSSFLCFSWSGETLSRDQHQPYPEYLIKAVLGQTSKSLPPFFNQGKKKSFHQSCKAKSYGPHWFLLTHWAPHPGLIRAFTATLGQGTQSPDRGAGKEQGMEGWEPGTRWGKVTPVLSAAALPQCPERCRGAKGATLLCLVTQKRFWEWYKDNCHLSLGLQSIHRV